MSVVQLYRRVLLASIAGFAVAAIGPPSHVHATPITFIYQGTGTGSINGTPFTHAEFTILAGADTDNRRTASWGFYVDHDWASISISGVGVYDLLTSTHTYFYQQDNGVGFARATGLDLYDGTNSALTNWDMLTSIGPAAGNMHLQQWTAEYDPVMTDGGRLIINGGSCMGTFQASVPEPHGIAMLFAGASGLLIWRRARATRRA